VLILYILGETLPTNIILFVFRRIPKTSVVRFPNFLSCNKVEILEEQQPIMSHAPLSYTPAPIVIKESPSRYDSDNEEENKPLKKNQKEVYVSPY